MPILRPLVGLRDAAPSTPTSTSSGVRPLVGLSDPGSYNDASFPAAPETIGGALNSGFQTGIRNVGATSRAFMASGLDAVGANEMAASQYAQARAAQERAQEFAPQVQDYQQVLDSDTPINTGLRYAAGQLGQGVASTLPAIGAGLLTRNKGVAARFLGGAGAMLPQEAGETALTIQNDPAAMQNTTALERAGISLGKGAVNALGESVVPTMLGSRLMTRAAAPTLGKAFAGFGKTVGHGIIAEGATEGAQEYVGQAAHTMANPLRDKSDDLHQTINSAIGGGLAGGGISSGPAAISSTLDYLNNRPAGAPKASKEPRPTTVDLGDPAKEPTTHEEVVADIHNLGAGIGAAKAPTTAAEHADAIIREQDPSTLTPEHIAAADEEGAKRSTMSLVDRVDAMYDHPDIDVEDKWFLGSGLDVNDPQVMARIEEIDSKLKGTAEAKQDLNNLEKSDGDLKFSKQSLRNGTHSLAEAMRGLSLVQLPDSVVNSQAEVMQTLIERGEKTGSISADSANWIMKVLGKNAAQSLVKLRGMLEESKTPGSAPVKSSAGPKVQTRGEMGDAKFFKLVNKIAKTQKETQALDEVTMQALPDAGAGVSQEQLNELVNGIKKYVRKSMGGAEARLLHPDHTDKHTDARPKNKQDGQGYVAETGVWGDKESNTYLTGVFADHMERVFPGKSKKVLDAFYADASRERAEVEATLKEDAKVSESAQDPTQKEESGNSVAGSNESEEGGGLDLRATHDSDGDMITIADEPVFFGDGKNDGLLEQDEHSGYDRVKREMVTAEAYDNNRAVNWMSAHEIAKHRGVPLVDMLDELKATKKGKEIVARGGSVKEVNDAVLKLADTHGLVASEATTDSEIIGEGDLHMMKTGWYKNTIANGKSTLTREAVAVVPKDGTAIKVDGLEKGDNHFDASRIVSWMGRTSRGGKAKEYTEGDDTNGSMYRTARLFADGVAGIAAKLKVSVLMSGDKAVEGKEYMHVLDSTVVVKANMGEGKPAVTWGELKNFISDGGKKPAVQRELTPLRKERDGLIAELKEALSFAERKELFKALKKVIGNISAVRVKNRMEEGNEAIYNQIDRNRKRTDAEVIKLMEIDKSKLSPEQAVIRRKKISELFARNVAETKRLEEALDALTDYSEPATRNEMTKELAKLTKQVTFTEDFGMDIGGEFSSKLDKLQERMDEGEGIPALVQEMMGVSDLAKEGLIHLLEAKYGENVPQLNMDGSGNAISYAKPAATDKKLGKGEQIVGSFVKRAKETKYIAEEKVTPAKKIQEVLTLGRPAIEGTAIVEAVKARSWPGAAASVRVVDETTQDHRDMKREVRVPDAPGVEVVKEVKGFGPKDRGFKYAKDEVKPVIRRDLFIKVEASNSITTALKNKLARDKISESRTKPKRHDPAAVTKENNKRTEFAHEVATAHQINDRVRAVLERVKTEQNRIYLASLLDRANQIMMEREKAEAKMLDAIHDGDMSKAAKLFSQMTGAKEDLAGMPVKNSSRNMNYTAADIAAAEYVRDIPDTFEEYLEQGDFGQLNKSGMKFSMMSTNDKAARFDAMVAAEDYSLVNTPERVLRFFARANERLAELRSMDDEQTDLEKKVEGVLTNLMYSPTADLAMFMQETEGFRQLTEERQAELEAQAESMRFDPRKKYSVSKNNEVKNDHAIKQAVEKKKAKLEEARQNLNDLEDNSASQHAINRKKKYIRILEAALAKDEERLAASPSTDRITQKEIDDNLAYFAKVFGHSVPNVEHGEFTQFAGAFKEAWNDPVSGKEMQKATILVSVYSKDPTGVRYHEALHAWFAALRKNGDNKVIKEFLNFARSPEIMSQLRTLLRDEPAALKQISEDHEEAAAYAFQFWNARNEDGTRVLKLSAKPTGLLNQVKEVLQRYLGIWTQSERAEKIMDYFNSGEYASNIEDRSAVHRALIAKGRNGTIDHMRRGTDMAVAVTQAVLGIGSARIRDYNIPSYTEIVDLISRHTTDTGEDRGYLNAVGVGVRNLMNDVMKDLERFDEVDIKAAFNQMQSKTNPDEFIEIKKHLRKFFDERMKALNNAKISLGFIEDYVPVLWDPRYIAGHQGEFIAMLKKAKAMGRLQDAGSPEEIMARLMSDDGAEIGIDAKIPKTKASPGMQQLKTRFLDIDDADRAPFLVQDYLHTITSYARQSTRRIEWKNRFGDDGAKMEALIERGKKEGATEEEEATLRKYIAGVDGSLGSDISPNARKYMATAMVFSNVRLLGLGWFSSLLDAGGVKVNGGEWKDALATYKLGITQLLRGFKTNPNPNATIQFAEDIGAIERASLVSASMSANNYNTVTGATRTINDLLFKVNLMEQQTKNMRAGASVAAARFIARQIGDGAGKHSERWLAELGLTKDDVNLDSNGELVVFEGTQEYTSKMKMALNTWVDGAIVRPDQSKKALWMNDPLWVLVAHMKTYTFAFHDTILKKVLHEADYGNYGPAYALVSYVPMAMAVMAAKSVIQGGGDVPEWQKDWGFGDYLWNAISKSGMTGTGQFVVDELRGVASHNYLNALGPTASFLEHTVGDINKIGGGAQFINSLIPTSPFDSLTKLDAVAAGRERK